MRTASLLLAFLAVALGVTTTSAAAQGTMSVSADPATLHVAMARAGEPPDPKTEGTTTYDLRDVASASAIVARLGTPLPPGTTLRVALTAPVGAVSRGLVTLGTTDREVVGSVPPGSHGGLSITYELSATAGAGTVPLTAVDVVFTLRTQ